MRSKRIAAKDSNTMPNTVQVQLQVSPIRQETIKGKESHQRLVEPVHAPKISSRTHHDSSMVEKSQLKRFGPWLFSALDAVKLLKQTLWTREHVEGQSPGGRMLASISPFEKNDRSKGLIAGVTDSPQLCNTASSSLSTDIKNPIHMGYLWKFCETEYSSESIQFIIDVDRLRDLMALYMVPVWVNRNWRETDEVVRILEQKGCNDDAGYRNTLEMTSTILLKHCATEIIEPGMSGSSKICGGPLHRNRADSLAIPVAEDSGPEGEWASARLLSAEDRVKGAGVGVQPAHIGVKQRSAFQDKTRDADWSATWLRNLAEKDLIDREIDRIWWTYLVDEAPRQVCVSQAILDRTRIRAKYCSLYGPDIFAEALFDPLRTLRGDIIGRFMKSKEYRDMSAFLRRPLPNPLPALASCLDGPVPMSVPVPHPTTSLFSQGDEDFLHCRSFTLRELVVDRHLYPQFHAFLSSRNLHVPLLGVRLLTILEERVLANDEARAEEVAWEIYRYFVAKGAPHEVDLGEMDHKVVLLALSKPFVGMFKALKVLLCAQVVKHFEEFKTTNEYRLLPKVVMDVLKKERQSNEVIVKGGFRLW